MYRGAWGNRTFSPPIFGLRTNADERVTAQPQSKPDSVQRVSDVFRLAPRVVPLLPIRPRPRKMKKNVAPKRRHWEGSKLIKFAFAHVDQRRGWQPGRFRGIFSHKRDDGNAFSYTKPNERDTQRTGRARYAHTFQQNTSGTL
jgi:hypothetical protein